MPSLHLLLHSDDWQHDDTSASTFLSTLKYGKRVVSMLSCLTFLNCFYLQFKMEPLCILTVDKIVTDVVINTLSNVIIKKLEKRIIRKKRIWIKNWISKRVESGASSLLLKELIIEDEEHYKNYLRLNKLQFNELLSRISSNIQKRDTQMRDAIPAKVKLEITLRYLASGCSFSTLQYLHRVPKSTISKFIPEVCDAISDGLKEFFKVPSTKVAWEIIEEGFNSKWNFPKCIGAIDGKHVVIRAPWNCGSDFYNYKGSNSIILLALVDDNYCFIYVDIGCNGRASDGGVFAKSSLYNILENRELQIPENTVIVGDEAFPLKKYLMKPYPQSGGLDYKKNNFNYRLSRARRIVENAFGILVSRFRIFEKPIPLEPEKVDKIIKTACSLHNWIRKTSTTDIDTSVKLHEGKHTQGFQDVRESMGSNFYSREAKLIRENYANYFIGEGAVSWQDNMIY